MSTIRSLLKKICPDRMVQMLICGKVWAIYNLWHRKELRKVFQCLSDDESCAVLNAFIKFKSGLSPNALLRMTKYSQEQYFDKSLIFLGGGETFIDMGVLDGGTSLQFIKEVGGLYDNVLLFEPDKQSYERTKKNMHGYKNIYLFHEGCSDHDGTMCFTNDGTGNSRIAAEGDSLSEIHVVSLDSKLKTLPNVSNITYIKMDIEGHEMQALKGSIDTIKKFKPRLAISIYHKREDIWEIPLLIKEMAADYKLYIRHYYTPEVALQNGETAWDALNWELVLYAIA